MVPRLPREHAIAISSAAARQFERIKWYNYEVRAADKG